MLLKITQRGGSRMTKCRNGLVFVMMVLGVTELNDNLLPNICFNFLFLNFAKESDEITNVLYHMYSDKLRIKC